MFKSPIPFPIPLTPHDVADDLVKLRYREENGHLADLRPMPRTKISEGANRAVYRYRPDPDVPTREDMLPVLLVPPLAAPALCFDLRRSCSLVEHLLASGRPVYLVDYGPISFSDRRLGIEAWIRDIIPSAITDVSSDAGGRNVHVVSWSLGGIMSLLAAADHPELPIQTLTPIGSPFDINAVPLVAPLRPILRRTGGQSINMIYKLAGTAPQPLVKQAFKFSSFDKLLTKPLTIARNLNDRDFIAQLQAVDHFTENMYAYPGRTFGQLFHRVFRSNDLATGAITIDGHTVKVSDVKQPVLVIAGATDGIAPKASVHASVPLLTGSADVRFEICPGGHLGVLTGRAARRTTWPLLDEWMATHD
jgi:polyhydroxyalkanoate synthase